MKKVSLVVLDATRKESLKKLRKLGVVHLEQIDGTGPVLASFKDASAKTERSISILEDQKIAKKNLPVQKTISDNKDVLAQCEKIISLSEKKKSLLDKISNETLELERFTKWGSVDPADFAYLAEKGIFLYMYEIPPEKYALIPATVKTILVNTTKNVTRFLLLSEEQIVERPKELPPEAFAISLPAISTDGIVRDIVNAQKEIKDIEAQLVSDIQYRDAIKAYHAVLAKDIEFENVYSGMGREEEADVYSDDMEEAEAEANDTESEEDEVSKAKLSWLTGYVPVDSLEQLKKACHENDWALACTDPSDDDPVPTKLHNNKFISIIYPLTDFLGTTPGYHEYDISGWFLLFFSLFFAMIFGDGGYGAIISLVAIGLIIKSAVTKKNVPSVLWLMLVLGLSTVIWGTVTCTWFGIEMKYLPDWLKNISFAPFSAANPDQTSVSTNLQIFCFAIGLVQLSLAHIKGMIRNRKSLKLLGELGSMLMLWGMFYVVLDMVVDSAKYPLGITAETEYLIIKGIYIPVPYIAIGTLAVGFILNFTFSNYAGNIGKSILESVKNIISVILGIVNVFSDIVSYIRLWAVALAGSAISSTVNGMAGPTLGHFIMFLGIILLLFGHGLNMVLNLLSVVVHGVRLNTLEFSSHLGMSWSGTKYAPFSEGNGK
jgi:V/A-type H+-transporting ATPase subunit I